jgi:hypothetical protein
VASRVRAHLALAGLSVAVLSGCSLLPNSTTHREPESTHTMQDLCDFPKQFLATEFHVRSVTVQPVGADQPPMSRKLGYDSLCDLNNADPAFAGSVGMAFSSTPVPPNPGTTRTWTIDGVSVQEIPLPRSSSDPGKYPYIGLEATIDKWTGTFGFPGGEEPTIKAAAAMLVNMIRTLKN